MLKTKDDATNMVENFKGELVHDEKGKIIQKTETWQKEQNVFKYAYDVKGRLARVYKNNKLVESYSYNYLGQRLRDLQGNDYEYTDNGRLYAAGGLKMRYDEFGQIWSREQNIRSAKLEKRIREYPESVPCIDLWGRIKFNFEDKKLVGVVLPSYDRIRYEYDRKPTDLPAVAGLGANEAYTWNTPSLLSDIPNERINDGIMPVRIYCDNKLAWECQWRKDMAPLQLVDNIKNITYTWIYESEEHIFPAYIFIDGDIIKKLGLASGTWGANKERFYVGHDQVGSVRALINSKGKMVKRIDYDSFGNVLSDSLSKLFIPQGFASGMTDPYTGLTRFGHRYYDPRVGRFVTLDPAKDRRGDNDLYDYCADDPVSRFDRTGLSWLQVARAIGGAAVKGIGVPWAIGTAVDEAKEDKTQPSGGKAVEDVAPRVAATAATGALVGGGMASGAGAIAGVAAPKASYLAPAAARYIEPATKTIKNVSDAVEGFALEGIPPASWAGIGGYALSKADEIWNATKKTYKKINKPESMLDPDGWYQRK